MFNSFPIPKPDSGGNNRKSVQNGVLTWSDANATIDIPISSVVAENSVIALSFNANQTANLNAVVPTFLSSTMIRLSKATGGALPRAIYWQVEEFNNVKSKQTGIQTIATSGIEQIVPVQRVNQAKCTLIVHNTSVAASVNAENLTNGSRIIDPVSVGFVGNSSNTIYWQLIEFR